jgi:hypothetical protein
MNVVFLWKKETGILSYFDSIYVKRNKTYHQLTFQQIYQGIGG